MNLETSLVSRSLISNHVYSGMRLFSSLNCNKATTLTGIAFTIDVVTYLVKTQISMLFYVSYVPPNFMCNTGALLIVLTRY